ncbi:MAG: glycosyltransferase family 1 protein [Phycisphaerales bacterium]|nr:glycosyltransferase family 1 protein [Phycisphaerales bacterium]
MRDRQQTLSDGFYFFFQRPPYDPGYHHYGVDVLVHEIKAAGAPVWSNIPGGPGEMKLFDYNSRFTVVFPLTEDGVNVEVLGRIEELPHRHKVILSLADSCFFMLTPPSVPALMGHKSRFLKLPGDHRPWAFGLSAERLARCSEPADFSRRRPVVLRNFRPSVAQSVRNALDLSLVPTLSRHLEVDREVGDDHFQRLSSCVACLAYGGEFGTNLAKNPALARAPGVLETFGRATFVADPLVVRWDSWRFWESLACGCVTIHLDMEKYGFVLPVMPEPWKHYVPIDLEDPKGTVERFMDERPRWAEIGAAGRQWALAHYTPRPMFERFLGVAMGLGAERAERAGHGRP